MWADFHDRSPLKNLSLVWLWICCGKRLLGSLQVTSLMLLWPVKSWDPSRLGSQGCSAKSASPNSRTTTKKSDGLRCLS